MQILVYTINNPNNKINLILKIEFIIKICQKIGKKTTKNEAYSNGGT